MPCETGDFMCSNGILCVRSYLKCDGINHCRDFSDESDYCTYGESILLFIFDIKNDWTFLEVEHFPFHVDVSGF